MRPHDDPPRLPDWQPAGPLNAAPHETSILLIDNYDSFAHNLARYFARLGQKVHVVRNDMVDAVQLTRQPPDAIVLSPGPGTPSQAGCCLTLVERFWHTIPILGVCLGHQVIAQACGGCVVRSPRPLHGQASRVMHDESPLYAGLPNPFWAARYHSLEVAREHLPEEIAVRATAEDGTVMAIEHIERPVVGWQFHPESILTECGYALLARFLARAGLLAISDVPQWCDELLMVEPAGHGPSWRRVGTL